MSGSMKLQTITENKKSKRNGVIDDKHRSVILWLWLNCNSPIHFNQSADGICQPRGEVILSAVSHGAVNCQSQFPPSRHIARHVLDPIPSPCNQRRSITARLSPSITVNYNYRVHL